MEQYQLYIGVGIALYAFRQLADLVLKLRQNGKPHDQYKELIERHLNNQKQMIDLQEQQLEVTKRKNMQVS